MGVLNITPDSFYDGGRLWADGRLQRDLLLRTAETMCREGAAVLDIGGESTRPGAAQVADAEERDRVLGALQTVLQALDVAVSVDTSNPGLMREAAGGGAQMINDVRALRGEGALQAAVESGLHVCLMHMQNQPQDMQDAPSYSDPVAEVADFLRGRVQAFVQAGGSEEKVWVDPGFGFGKNLEHNLALLRNLGRIADLGYPVLAGISRKSMIGALTGREPQERLSGSLAAAVLAAQAGARMVRVHDVGATRDALAVQRAVAATPQIPAQGAP